MPIWYVRLAMAREWSTPPWQLFGGHPYFWELRWIICRNIEAEADRDKQQG